LAHLIVFVALFFFLLANLILERCLFGQYVDLEYEGGGTGEYQHWNITNNAWDTTACDYSDSERCSKMDCHLESTHFSLLGFFKHKSYDDWFEQLFKHEGKCVWNDEEYAFMSNAREAWPQGCIDSYTTTDNGGEIYYDIKPVQGGDIKVALYTDTQCITEYTSTGSNDPITVENILGNFFLENDGSGDSGYDFSSDSLEESMERWNSAFAKFRICQPCVAYDLENVDGSKYYDDDGGGDGDMFECYDDADYTNVNQVCDQCISENLLTVVNHNQPFPLKNLSFRTHCSVHLFYSQFMTIAKYIQTVHEVHGQDKYEHRDIQRYVARKISRNPHCNPNEWIQRQQKLAQRRFFKRADLLVLVFIIGCFHLRFCLFVQSQGCNELPAHIWMG
jgi:hypothetical protein